MEEEIRGQATVEAMVTIDYKSYKEFYWRFIGGELRGRLIAIAVMLALSLFVAWAWSSVLASFFDRSDSFWTILYILSLLPAGSIVLTVSSLIKERPRKIYEKHKTIMAMEKQYTFFENHLIIKMPHYYSAAEYMLYTETQESKGSFYLKMPEGGYVQLPKKCFTEEQVEALRALFERKFEKKFKTNL